MNDHYRLSENVGYPPENMSWVNWPLCVAVVALGACLVAILA